MIENFATSHRKIVLLENIVQKTKKNPKTYISTCWLKNIACLWSRNNISRKTKFLKNSEKSVSFLKWFWKNCRIFRRNDAENSLWIPEHTRKCLWVIFEDRRKIILSRILDFPTFRFLVSRLLSFGFFDWFFQLLIYRLFKLTWKRVHDF